MPDEVCASSLISLEHSFAVLPRLGNVMAQWKSDPVIGLVFAEITALWKLSTSSGGPILLRVEERDSVGTESAASPGRLVNVWLFDDHGVRLAPILRREAHDFGATRDGYHSYGLVRFVLSTDRTLVTLTYWLGPSIGGELVYEVQSQQGVWKLQALSDAVTS